MYIANLICGAIGCVLLAIGQIYIYQLNHYIVPDQLKWFLKKKNRLWPFAVLLLIAIIVPIVKIGFLFGGFVLLSVGVVAFIIQPSSLKYTTRAIRLLIATFILQGLLFFCWKSNINISINVVGALTPLLVILADYLNKPIDILQRNYFINDAKKILASASDLTIIGITGSCGKTSMKYYLNTILSTKFNVLMTPGSCNTPLGIVRIIRERLKADHDIFICEMGARRCGEIKEICDIVNPKHGIVTAVAGQHLETFGSLENIRKTKYELLNSLPKDGFGFVNGDSAPVREALPEIAAELFVYGSSADSSFVISDLTLNPCVSFKLNGVEFRTKLLGAHNALNVAGAAAIAVKLGMSIEECAKAASLITGVSKRLELKESLEATVIDDAFNSNPDGSIGALEALSRFDGCRILVTPGMFELGAKQYDFNYNFGKKAASICEIIILMGVNSKAIADGAISAGFNSEKIILLNNLEEAKAAALNYQDERHKIILFENSLPDHC